MPPLPRPFFAGILYALGAVAIVNAFFFLLLGIAVAQTMSVETLAATGLYEAFSPMFFSTVCGAVLIALGQMLAFMPLTAFHAELCAELLRSQSVDAPAREQTSANKTQEPP